MTTLTQSLGRSQRITLIGIVGFAAAVAAASQIAIPLPWTPVPITLQPMLVILAGMFLGPVAGAASMALYLAAGAAGLPARRQVRAARPVPRRPAVRATLPAPAAPAIAPAPVAPATRADPAARAAPAA